MRRARVLGGVALLAALALDRASKYAALESLGGARQPLLPFLDLSLQFNPGISFSLFPQDSATGVTALLALTLVASVALGVWAWFAKSSPVAIGLGAIVGGALGNAWDRWTYGKVVDFLDFHAFGRNFFVFNVADAAINLGVALLLLDALLPHARDSQAREIKY